MEPLNSALSLPSSARWVRLSSLAILALPVTLLGMAALRSTGEQRFLLGLGALFQALGFVLAVWGPGKGAQTITPPVIMLYVIGLSWIVLGGIQVNDWFFHVAQSLLLVVPVTYFALQCLKDSGVLALRRGRQLAQQLAIRRDWPEDLNSCRSLPEVKALRDCLYVDAEPALALLGHPRPQVHVAALAALEFRKNWQAGQPEMVLEVARQSAETEVRAAAINALANIDDQVIVEALGDFLCDPALSVRQTATVALLWNAKERWPWIRMAVRHSLGNPLCKDDGPLVVDAAALTSEAVADLTAWAAEKGVLAVRAAQTLGDHYAQVLSVTRDPGLVVKLRQLLVDPHTPSMLRLELGRLLAKENELDQTALRDLLDPANPAPLRLIAVEALLADGEPPEAVAALRDLARLPNREIALATAEVVQRRLGVDFGLMRNQPLPALHSRHAADVARRVLIWATQSETEDDSLSLRGTEAGYRI